MKPLYFSRVHTRCERYSLTKRLSMNRYSLSILCAAVVAVVTTLFIEHTRVVNIRRQFASESVRSDWNTARFVIRAYHNNMDWFLRRIYPLADSEGYVIQLSKPYRLLGLPLPPNTNSELRVWESRSSSDSNHYLLCTGPILNENGERYQLTVGKRLD
jgi:D-mannonate dehydratase